MGSKSGNGLEVRYWIVVMHVYRLGIGRMVKLRYN